MSDNDASDGQEKSFDPTPSRLEKARRDGDIALSRETTASAAYLGLYVVAASGAGGISIALAQTLRRLHEAPAEFTMLSDGRAHVAAVSLAKSVASSGALLLAAPAACVVAAIVAQKAFVFTPSKIAFKWSRLSIAENAKQKFGPQGLSEFLVSAAKLAGVLALFLLLFAGRYMQLPAAALLPAEAAAPALHKEAVLLLGAVLILSVAIAAFDAVRVHGARRKRLMMSLDDIRRESKETEGDPHMKQSRRERSRALATNRMLLDVPKASVVIVNPTHYAVALKWDGPKTGAPVVIAKGV
ncbi:MAG: EscU/YscU/HrcU family type III secretion system export apparatus switch protein, partial [Parvularculaceae bacterium]|nr:EscU/YscU/HrcU family type III secretion system export apparatus switch protein [Parvularculaceae bacterium]